MSEYKVSNPKRYNPQVLELPINEDINLNNASYKNPSRLLVRPKQLGIKLWTGYFIIGNLFWPLPLGFRHGEHPNWEDEAYVFTAAQSNKPWFGVNWALAVQAHYPHLSVSEVFSKMHIANNFGVFSVNPEETERTLIWWCQNDLSIIRGHKDNPITPEKIRSSSFPLNGRKLPPKTPEFYFPEPQKVLMPIIGDDDTKVNPPEKIDTEPAATLPITWGILGNPMSQYRINKVKEVLPNVTWYRASYSMKSVMYREGDGTTKVDETFEESLDVALSWYNLTRDNGLNILIHVVDDDIDIQDRDLWENWVLSLAMRVEKGTWFFADAETGLKQYGLTAIDYVELWRPIIPKLQMMGHYVVGPGSTVGNKIDLAFILRELNFDAPSVHFYTDDLDKHIEWVNDAKKIMLNNGYTWGVVGESGTHGGKLTFWDKISCKWNGDAVQLKRARTGIKNTFHKDPFWRMKIWYQILDDPRFDGPKDVGFGLFKFTINNKGEEVWAPKPIASTFNNEFFVN